LLHLSARSSRRTYKSRAVDGACRKPFTAFFTPRLKESSLFHAASNARRAI
jgi:hypothetical protein